MYPVSDAFLRAVRSNTRKYFWTGTIVTKGGMTYEFGAKEIVKGSGYISRQCCGSTEIELGTVYAAEMGITLLSDIDRYTLEDALVTLSVYTENDIETCRDVLFYVAQVLGGFFIINREGKLELKGSCDEGGAETPVFFQFFGFYYQVHGSEFHQQADADCRVLCSGSG